MQMANKHMKRISASLVFREMQIKTTLRYHFISIRIAAIKKKKKRQTASVDKNVEKLEFPCIFGGHVNGV